MTRLQRRYFCFAASMAALASSTACRACARRPPLASAALGTDEGQGARVEIPANPVRLFGISVSKGGAI